MTEDKKKKPGLHKKISSIFEGVPLPQPGSPPPPPPAPSGEQGAGGPQKPLPPPFQQIRVSAGMEPRGFEAMQPAASVGQVKAEPAVKGVRPGLWQRTKGKLLEPKPGVSGGRQKSMLVLVPALAVILIVVLIWVFGLPGAVTETRKPKAPVTAVAADTVIEWEIPEAYPETLHDPTRTAVEPNIVTTIEVGTQKVEEVKPLPILVKGILYSDDAPSAIVGTEIVHVGDKVAGATVVGITKTTVEFEMDGKKWTQGLQP